jgi:hypothetical protein
MWLFWWWQCSVANTDTVAQSLHSSQNRVPCAPEAMPASAVKNHRFNPILSFWLRTIHLLLFRN